jgi:hypothetical protein
MVGSLDVAGNPYGFNGGAPLSTSVSVHLYDPLAGLSSGRGDAFAWDETFASSDIFTSHDALTSDDAFSSHDSFASGVGAIWD